MNQWNKSNEMKRLHNWNDSLFGYSINCEWIRTTITHYKKKTFCTVQRSKCIWTSIECFGQSATTTSTSPNCLLLHNLYLTPVYIGYFSLTYLSILYVYIQQSRQHSLLRYALELTITMGVKKLYCSIASQNVVQAVEFLFSFYCLDHGIVCTFRTHIVQRTTTTATVVMVMCWGILWDDSIAFCACILTMQRWERDILFVGASGVIRRSTPVYRIIGGVPIIFGSKIHDSWRGVREEHWNDDSERQSERQIEREWARGREIERGSETRREKKEAREEERESKTDRITVEKLNRQS